MKAEELKKLSPSKNGHTILLHKRPYDFRRQRPGAPSCASIISTETAYFKNEQLQFGNRSSEGFRLDSTKSCAVELNQSLLELEIEKSKDAGKLQEMTSDDSCFKVPRSIVRRPDIPSSSQSIYASGLSGKYLGMINHKNLCNGQRL